MHEAGGSRTHDSGGMLRVHRVVRLLQREPRRLGKGARHGLQRSGRYARLQRLQVPPLPPRVALRGEARGQRGLPHAPQKLQRRRATRRVARQPPQVVARRRAHERLLHPELSCGV